MIYNFVKRLTNGNMEVDICLGDIHGLAKDELMRAVVVAVRLALI